MTALEMTQVVGAEVHVHFEDITVFCMVEDIKSAYGRDRFLISPLYGTGSQWVEGSRIEWGVKGRVK